MKNYIVILVLALTSFALTVKGFSLQFHGGIMELNQEALPQRNPVLAMSHLLADTTSRNVIVNQLKKLKQALAQNNPAEVAEFFSFPETNQNLLDLIKWSSPETDSVPELKSLTKENFYNYFKFIKPSLEETLQVLNLNQLSSKSKIKKIKPVKKDDPEEWSWSYSIEIKGKQVMLGCGNSSTSGESYTRWTFELTYGKLKFKELYIAG